MRGIFAIMQNAEFDPQRFRWDDVRVLLAVVRHATLSAAAAELGVNASTIGRRVDALEQALGARLFDRSPDGAKPTEALERLLPAATEFEHAAADLVRAVEGFEREPEGLVRLTAPPGVAQFLVAPALPKLLRAFPKLRVQIDATIGYADLTRREADIALRIVRPSAGDLVSVRLGVATPEVLAAPRYATTLTKNGPLEDPARARWVDWGPDLHHIPPSVWVRGRVPAEQIVLQTSNMAVQVEAVRAGLGVMLGSKDMAGAAGLRAVELHPKLRAEFDAAPPSALWLVGHRALRRVPRVAAVWDFLVGQGQRF